MSYISWDLVFDIIKYVPCDDLRSLSKASPMFDEIFVQVGIKIIYVRGSARVPKVTDLIIVTMQGQYIELRDHEFCYSDNRSYVCLRHNIYLSAGLRNDCDYTHIKIDGIGGSNDYMVYSGTECLENTECMENAECTENNKKDIIRSIDVNNKLAFVKSADDKCYSLRRFKVIMINGNWA